uniref:ATP synthase F0 subunit 8 n=1 Tax=Cleistostoma dilatatum TaxID=156090 RepID=UPI001EDFBCAA|nr:ATP synthase F0 subunit 8 [Cleistostoma dilatatum]UIP56968.1 ATP synthase F0 subunit 8 [Cleistostoma dilatatum]UPL64976.1 ATP synthase F0 subunit 8 [Cleistostoma dilatatum]
MPQMAPIYWLYLLFFFLSTLALFFVMNYFIKPFNLLDSSHYSKKTNFKSWKL